MKKNKRIVDWLFLGGAAIILIGILAWNHRPAPPDGIAWHTTLAEARKAAAESGKPIFVKFTAEWCGPCKRMDRSTFPNPDVGKTLASFEAVKVDIDKYPDLAGKFGVQSIPTLIVMTPAGEITKRTSGALGASDFVSFLTSAGG